MITDDDIDASVTLPIDDFDQLEGGQLSFKDILLSGPTLSDADVDLINDRCRYIIQST